MRLFYWNSSAVPQRRLSWSRTLICPVFLLGLCQAWSAAPAAQEAKTQQDPVAAASQDPKAGSAQEKTPANAQEKADPAKVDPAKADPAKADPAKVDPAKAPETEKSKLVVELEGQVELLAQNKLTADERSDLLQRLDDAVFAVPASSATHLKPVIEKVLKASWQPAQASRVKQVEAINALRAWTPSKELSDEDPLKAATAASAASLDLLKQLTAAFPAAKDDKNAERQVAFDFYRASKDIAAIKAKIAEKADPDAATISGLDLRLNVLNARVASMASEEGKFPESFGPTLVRIKNEATIPLEIRIGTHWGTTKRQIGPEKTAEFRYATLVKYHNYDPKKNGGFDTLEIKKPIDVSFKYHYISKNNARWEPKTSEMKSSAEPEGPKLPPASTKTVEATPFESDLSEWGFVALVTEQDESEGPYTKYLRPVRDRPIRDALAAMLRRFEKGRQIRELVENDHLYTLTAASVDGVLAEQSLLKAVSNSVNNPNATIDECDNLIEVTVYLKGVNDTCSQAIQNCDTALSKLQPKSEDDRDRFASSRKTIDEGRLLVGHFVESLAQIDPLVQDLKARAVSKLGATTTNEPSATEKELVSKVNDLRSVTSVLAVHFLDKDDELERSRSQSYSAWRNQFNGVESYWYCTYRFTPPGTDDCRSSYCIWFERDPNYVYYFFAGSCQYWGRYNLAEGHRSNSAWQWLPIKERQWTSLGCYPAGQFDNTESLPVVPYAQDSLLKMLWPNTVGLPAVAPRDFTILSAVAQDRSNLDTIVRTLFGEDSATDFSAAPAPAPPATPVPTAPAMDY